MRTKKGKHVLLMKNRKIYAQEQRKIAVIGAGNIGTQFACICASKGYIVNVHSSKPEHFDMELEIVNENNEVVKGKVAKVTSDMGEAVQGCSVLFVTHPAFQLKKTAELILPYVNDGMNICIIPGTGGAEFAFRECIKAGATLCGLQRVPGVARLEKYGKRVRVEGLRERLFLAAIPSSKATELANFVESLFDIPCEAMLNYLSVTLTPSNPILHTTRLRTLFADYSEGVVYERNPLFYGEWSDESSALLLACDEELQQMCKMISDMDLTNVRSLKLHYESNTVDAMTKKMCSIKSLHNLTSPMKKVDGGWIPDFNSRYFTADFPYGLAILESMAVILGFDAKNIRETMDWYRKVSGDNSRLELKDYGIQKLQDFYTFYID